MSPSSLFRLVAVAGFLLVVAPDLARAADCAAPRDAHARALCADPALLALEARVEAYYRDMAEGPWRHGLRARHDAAMARLRREADPLAIREGLEAHLAALRVEAGWFSTHGLEEAPERRIRTACLALPGEQGAPAQARPCRLARFGDLGRLDGRRWAYALYEYAPDPTGELANEAAVVVFAAGSPGSWTVEIAERLTEASCQPPRLVRHGQDDLLFLPCAETGTAGGAIPMLYRRTGPPSFRRWQTIDAEAWQAGLAARLPAGLAVRGTVAFDPARMSAGFGLWRDADPGCCPTGGRGQAALALQDDRLVLRDVTLSAGR